MSLVGARGRSLPAPPLKGGVVKRASLRWLSLRGLQWSEHGSLRTFACAPRSSLASASRSFHPTGWNNRVLITAAAHPSPSIPPPLRPLALHRTGLKRMLGLRTSALSKLTQRVTARGMGSGMGGGGHANNPAFMFQAQYGKEKWRAMIILGPLCFLGIFVPYKCVSFAQRKAGVAGW